MTKQTYRKIKKWFITFPDSKDRSEFWIWKLWKADIYFYEAACGVKEMHDETGKAHLHFAVHLKHGISKSQLLNKIKAIEPDDWKRVHVVAMKSTVDRCHEEYLAKEGVPWVRYFRESHEDYLRRTDPWFYNQCVKQDLIDEENCSQLATLEGH